MMEYSKILKINKSIDNINNLYYVKLTFLSEFARGNKRIKHILQNTNDNKIFDYAVNFINQKLFPIYTIENTIEIVENNNLNGNLTECVRALFENKNLTYSQKQKLHSEEYLFSQLSFDNLKNNINLKYNDLYYFYNKNFLDYFKSLSKPKKREFFLIYAKNHNSFNYKDNINIFNRKDNKLYKIDKCCISAELISELLKSQKQIPLELEKFIIKQIVENGLGIDYKIKNFKSKNILNLIDENDFFICKMIYSNEFKTYIIDNIKLNKFSKQELCKIYNFNNLFSNDEIIQKIKEIINDKKDLELLNYLMNLIINQNYCLNQIKKLEFKIPKKIIKFYIKNISLHQSISRLSLLSARQIKQIYNNGDCNFTISMNLLENPKTSKKTIKQMLKSKSRIIKNRVKIKLNKTKALTKFVVAANQ